MDEPGLEQTYPEGRVAIERMAPGLLLVRLRGTLPAEAAEWLSERTQALLQGRRAHVFYDTREFRSFAFGFQKAMTQWTVSNREGLEGVHVLTASPMVRMGISVANIALRGWITAYDDVEGFNDALVAAGGAAKPKG